MYDDSYQVMSNFIGQLSTRTVKVYFVIKVNNAGLPRSSLLLLFPHDDWEVIILVSCEHLTNSRNLQFNFETNDSESQFEVGICLTPVWNIFSVKLQYIGQGSLQFMIKILMSKDTECLCLVDEPWTSELAQPPTPPLNLRRLTTGGRKKEQTLQ